MGKIVGLTFKPKSKGKDKDAETPKLPKDGKEGETPKLPKDGKEGETPKLPKDGKEGEKDAGKAETPTGSSGK